MMNESHRAMLRTHGTMVGRMLMGLLFFWSGGSMLLAGAAPAINTVESLGLPLPVVLGWLVVLVKVLGGLALIVGFRVGIAAAGLIVFTLLTVLFVHSDVADPNQQTQALKNLAIVGGLLYVMAYGPGEGWKLSGGETSKSSAMSGAGSMSTSPTQDSTGFPKNPM